ncbi:HipA family kinase [Mammaliicoccus sciuri]|uniref:HipA family kinase n=1 Tax=Mammaliicoccus sciuri TaxID=1296 RepID=UPI00129984B6|nr:HipA family kinase [Mammaliicoccus sciuri]MEB8263473.1 hypothetical protein [Mammaliicoccus sciuri]MRE71016.1 hypothetical protein [Mammaliicoccus sciuri]
MREVQVETFIQKLSEGMSGPSLVLCDDGKKYILKKEEEKQSFDSTFINEVVAYKLAKYLEIPVCECAVAKIDKELVDFDRDIVFVHQFREGMYFASQEEPNVVNNMMENAYELKQMGKPYVERTWNDFFRSVYNKKDFAKIIALDLLICNYDRFNHLNNFLVSKEGSSNKIIAIDHGHAFFGPQWNNEKIALLDGYNRDNNFLQTIFELYLRTSNGHTNLGIIFKAIESNINLTNINNHDFINIIARIESLNEGIIEEIFEDIPKEWFKDREMQKEYYKRFLLQHKNYVRNIIQYLAEKNYFTNYRGGELGWKETKGLRDITQL